MVRLRLAGYGNENILEKKKTNSIDKMGPSNLIDLTKPYIGDPIYCMTRHILYATN